MKPAQRTIAITVLAAVLLAPALLTIASADGKSKKTAEGKWAKHYHKRIEQFQRENAAAKNIVLVGSSHLEGFDAAKWLPGRRVANRGIAADRIGITERGILHRLNASVFDCNPGFVLIENGVNDLGELRRNGTPSIDEIDVCYRKVVKEIRTRLPDVPFLIVGLFPTRDRWSELNPMIVELNQRFVKIAADFNCPFMEVYKPFADENGLLREDFSRDGLHLNQAGYELWAKMIRDVLPPDVAIIPKTQDKGSQTQ